MNRVDEYILNDYEVHKITDWALKKVREIDRYNHGKMHNIMQNYGSFFSGIACEYALAQLIGLGGSWEPTPENKRFEGDVYGNEVRTTPFRNGQFIVKETDKDTRFMFFVDSYFLPKLTVVGYTLISAVKKPEYFYKKTPKGLNLYSVPRHALIPFEEYLR